MEKTLKFNSQVATNRSQSARLLALGLKKETADMALVPLMEWDDCTAQEYFTGEYVARTKEDVERYNLDYISAWSLYRLWKLLDKIKKYEGEDELSYPRISLVEEDVIVENPKSLWVRQSFISPKGVYENIINCLEELINKGYFNKEYLVDQDAIDEHCKGVLEYLDYIREEE